MKKIILTGGGTAGHITPNLAILPLLRTAGFDVSYIGLKNGMEEGLIRPTGVPFYGIKGGKLRRYADFKNFTDLFRIGAGFTEAISLMHRIKPDVLFSKGGFVSSPVVWAAKLCGVPVVTHESDSTIGLANRISVPFAKKVCYTFPETGTALPSEKGVLTGLPIREELLHGQKEKGLQFCGFSSDKPVLVITGGSQGAAFINAMVRRCLPDLLKTFQICHLCGKGNLDTKLEGTPGYRQFAYISEELPDIFAMADLVITRGGSTSLFELLALQKPMVIIPYSRKASRGDQIVNGRSFKKQGFGELLMETDESGMDMMPAAFLRTVQRVYDHREQYVEQMRSSPARGGASNVFNVICEVAGVSEAAGISE
ncbi:MAG TPA: undecaprenyldiphospho-muramoylpentapeptide beta-N-acetylglucosaminyltransferase [Ruminococcaceae bacterium]|nr:undecaprenyldiphospho-muramoylpentapeptide beta-N-acetylglucosaminyltransferase [Oscillospiraceae bacterium]